MSMPVAYCTPGAEVAKVLDIVGRKTDSQGQVIGYEFASSRPPKRGFIVKCKYSGDETFSADSIEYVLCKFKPGEPPEKCLPTQLNLIKVANEAAQAALKSEIEIQNINNGLIDDMKKPVVIDQTNVGKTKPGKGLSKNEAENLK